jgi:glutaredoxin-like protein NrdH
VTGQQTVRVYSKPACVMCNATMRWLKDRGVAFEVDDATDSANIAAAQSLGIMSAPIVVVDQVDGGVEAWGGFQPDKLAQYVVLP